LITHVLQKAYQHGSTAHMTKFLPALMAGSNHLIDLPLFAKHISMAAQHRWLNFDQLS